MDLVRDLVAVKDPENKSEAPVEFDSRPNSRADHAGYPNPVRPGINLGSTLGSMAERVSVNPY